ncbi:MAG TPA: TraB/GumN family protein [Usitatibacteraceae bacterium]|nr:TraB/GumN family protein [Usitatibacteraceae bacterium]
MRLALLAFSALVAFPWTALAQPATGIAPPPAARQYLWEVASLTNRIYLYGTVHAGKRSFYPLAPSVEKAFADSKVLAVEADITDARAMAIGASAMLFTPPDSLPKHVPAPMYERFRRQLDRFGLPEPQAAQMKPFIASSMLAFAEWGRQGYEQQYGVDLHLITRAREAKMSIVELEGAQVQASLMDSLTEKESLQAFEGTVAALESGLTRDQITGLVNAWQSGDPDLLLEVLRAYNESVPGARELEEKFIWSRHGEMAKKIEGWLLDGRDRVFVAVGAVHLAGPRGLVAMLRERGYTVRQL